MGRRQNSIRAQIANCLREHYKRVSRHEWYSHMEHAIRAYEREPELLDRIDELERDLALANAACMVKLPHICLDCKGEGCPGCDGIGIRWSPIVELVVKAQGGK